MKSSDLDGEADAIIEELIRLLDTERMGTEIDGPIDRVLEAFTIAEEPFSNEFFLQSISRFIQLLHRDALPLRRNLDEGEARDEAISVLRNYRGQGNVGYEAALFDASREERGGIDGVLTRIADLFKQAEREKKTNRILSTSPISSNWQLKRRVVETLVGRLGEFLPGFLRDKPVGQLCEDWRYLFNLYLQTRKFPNDLAVMENVFRLWAQPGSIILTPTRRGPANGG